MKIQFKKSYCTLILLLLPSTSSAMEQIHEIALVEARREKSGDVVIARSMRKNVSLEERDKNIVTAMHAAFQAQKDNLDLINQRIAFQNKKTMSKSEADEKTMSKSKTDKKYGKLLDQIKLELKHTRDLFNTFISQDGNYPTHPPYVTRYSAHISALIALFKQALDNLERIIALSDCPSRQLGFIEITITEKQKMKGEFQEIADKIINTLIAPTVNDKNGNAFFDVTPWFDRIAAF